MHKIFKYTLPVLEKHTIELPKDARIIRVEDVEGIFYLWAIVDPEAPLENRYLEFYKTGQPIHSDVENLVFLGSCKLFIMQELCLYVFENLAKTTFSIEDELYCKGCGQSVCECKSGNPACTHPNRCMFNSDLDWCPDCKEKFDPYNSLQ